MNDVIQQVLDGDTQAFREIVQAYGTSARTFLAGHINDSHAVEDLAQEIFIAVYTNLKTFDQSQEFGPWFRAIARNKLMSHLRQRYSPKNARNDYCAEIHEALLVDGDCSDVRAAETIARLRECIARHGEDDRHLIQVRYFDNEPVQRTAKRLSTTVSAISSQLYRIRHQLRACLRGIAEVKAS
jgi:RNA polymerase sigma-70 factor (ECF subfamily)